MGTTAILNNIKEIVRTFSGAVQNNDFELIASLLAEDGEFDTQDAEMNTLNVSSKSAFMQWFVPALSSVTIEKIDYDQCLHCRIGNPVVLFNDGQFPQTKRETSNVSMAGLMLDIKDGLIREIGFCYTFLARENKYQFEYLSEDVNKLTATGVPLREAVKIVLKEKGYSDTPDS